MEIQVKQHLDFFLLAFMYPGISCKYFINRKIVFNHNLNAKFQGSPYNQETRIKYITTKQPNLKLKTQTKQHLGIFLLAFLLPGISFAKFWTLLTFRNFVPIIWKRLPKIRKSISQLPTENRSHLSTENAVGVSSFNFVHSKWAKFVTNFVKAWNKTM